MLQLPALTLKNQTKGNQSTKQEYPKRIISFEERKVREKREKRLQTAAIPISMCKRLGGMER